MDYSKIGALIKEKRLEHKLKQTELADMLDVTYKTISKWECGRGCPDISIVEKLSEILGISILELLNGREKGKLDKYSKEYIKQAVRILNDERRKFISQILKLSILIIVFVVTCLQFFHISYLKEKQTYDFSESHEYFNSIFDKIDEDMEIIKEDELIEEEDYKSLEEVIDSHKKLTIVKLDKKMALTRKEIREMDDEYIGNVLVTDVIKSISNKIKSLNNFNNIYQLNYEHDLISLNYSHFFIKNTSLYESMIFSKYDNGLIKLRVYREKYELESISYILELVIAGDENE